MFNNDLELTQHALDTEWAIFLMSANGYPRSLRPFAKSHYANELVRVSNDHARWATSRKECRVFPELTFGKWSTILFLFQGALAPSNN